VGERVEQTSPRRNRRILRLRVDLRVRAELADPVLAPLPVMRDVCEPLSGRNKMAI
jgi:hypothetical protein